MIMSVSTLIIGKGAAMPVIVVNFSMNGNIETWMAGTSPAMTQESGEKNGRLLLRRERLRLLLGDWLRRRRARRLRGAALDQLLVIIAHGLAALGPWRMHRIALQRRDEGADLLHAHGVEPAPFHAAPDGKQVGLGLVRPFELVAAFMRIDVELHCGGEAADLLGVEDDEAREGAAPAVEIGIEHRRPLAAVHA